MTEVSINQDARLSEHFTLAELCKTSVKTKDGNIPSHVAIENLKRLTGWLEMLREEYNKRYSLPLAPSEGKGDYEQPIIINSGYRSPAVNKAVGGVATSNHLTGCAVDIRVLGMEQLLRYAVILLDISDESQEDFDELLLERNTKGTYWLHFAVRLRRVAVGAQYQRDLLAALCSKARGQQAENKADYKKSHQSHD